MNPRAGWWSSNGHKLAGAAAITAVAVAVLGWFTGIQDVMHGALLTVLVAAFLPFVIIGIGLLVILVIGLVLALPAAAADASLDLGGGDAVGEVVIEGGGKLLPRYYQFIGRQRHPVFWGIPLGIAVGSLVLWGLLALTRIPAEQDTVRQLALASRLIERVYQDTGEFPKPDAGRLTINGATLLDGFHRPLRYEVSGRWKKLSTWTVRSLGLDGELGDDDLCISGATRWRALAERAVDGVTGIKALRCQ